MPSITQLEYILAVNKHGHFGRAAESCHVSQPSLSSQIQKVEEELDTILFDRTKKPIKVTAAGAEVIAQAKIVLREHHKIFGVAQSYGSEPRGDFHLALIPTLSPYLLPLFIERFSKCFPKVELKVSELKTEEIITALETDEIDAGILVTPLGDDSIIERHLFFEPFYAYISEKHRFHKKKSLGENDLLGDDLWLLEEGHCFRDQVLKVCSLESRHSVLGNIEFESGNLETLKNLVRANTGYTLLPELATLSLSESDVKTHIKKFQKPVPTREVSIVHCRTYLKEAIINALEDTIIQCLPKKIKSLKKENIDVIDVEIN